MKVKVHGRNPRYSSEFLLSRSQAARFANMVNDMATHLHGQTPGRIVGNVVSRLGKVDREVSAPASEYVLKSLGNVATLLRQSKKAQTTPKHQSVKGRSPLPVLPHYGARSGRDYVRILDALPYHLVSPEYDVFVELLDRSAERVRVKLSETRKETQPDHDCSFIESEGPVTEKQIDTAKVEQLQARVDDLLAGGVDETPLTEKSRPFAPFLPSDKIRAQALEALCEKIADRLGGLEGLEAAIDKLYEKLDSAPAGMVEHAAKSFLTHYKPARDHLLIRSLEERQPAMVASSSKSGPFPG